jgi:hypothetical protein
MKALVRFLYKFLRLYNDFNAIKKGRIHKRIGRRVAGRLANQLFSSLFK